MVELQILSRVLKTKDISILTNNGIDKDYFATYPEEYSFIFNHLHDYGCVPDTETFISKFPNFTLVDVMESDKYLVDTINEEHLYSVTVPILNQIAELMQTDSREAVNVLQSKLPELMLHTGIKGKDIIANSGERFEEWKERCSNPTNFTIPTGFPELDEINGGWQRGEEFVVIFARTGVGKTWVMMKTLSHAWQVGYRVGIVEPEMSYSKTGYRFDTLAGNFSNSKLLRGEEVEGYGKYVMSLQRSKNPFYVATPKDFGKKITVSKLKAFCVTNQLDMLAVDGISYLTDERAQRGDNRTTSLTNISEDLMALSIELGIPVLVVCQSNREGASKDNPEGPDLENIRDSDGIAYNASMVIAVQQKGPGAELAIRKNRNGVNGSKLLYAWDIDSGRFTFVPTENTSETKGLTPEMKDVNDGTEVF